MKNNKKFVLVFFLLEMFFLSGTAVAENQPWSKPHYLQSSFIDIALNNEYSVNKRGVRKWNKPIKYYFEHHVADVEMHENLTRLHLNQISDITGLEINQVYNKRNANLLIVFSTEKRLKKDIKRNFNIRSKKQRKHLYRNSVCLADFSTYANSSIRKAIVLIPVDRASAHAKLISCIVEEITQIMGLPNDSERVFPSVFNDKSYNELLTGLDYLLLKILYHPRIKVGMNADSVKPALRRVIREFGRQGVIFNAQETVVNSGLYPVLYDL